MAQAAQEHFKPVNIRSNPVGPFHRPEQFKANKEQYVEKLFEAVGCGYTDLTSQLCTISIPANFNHEELGRNYIGLHCYFLGGEDVCWETVIYTGPRARPDMIQRTVRATSGDMWV